MACDGWCAAAVPGTGTRGTVRVRGGMRACAFLYSLALALAQLWMGHLRDDQRHACGPNEQGHAVEQQHVLPVAPRGGLRADAQQALGV